MAGVTAGVTAGLNEAGGFAAMGIKGSSFGTQALQGAISDAMAQGIGVATGLQKKFDWAGVAAAGLGNAVSGQIGGNGRGAQVVRMSADAVTGAAARSLLTGTSFGDNLLAVLPSVIGRTIGTLVQGAMENGSAVGLSAKDQKNPLFMVLSPKIPAKIVRELWARYQNGDLKLERQLGNISGWAHYEDGSGVAVFDRAGVALADHGEVGAMARASLMHADLQEVAHHLDDLAWRMAGVEGGDSPGDEGAIFAHIEAQRLAGIKGVNIRYSFRGTNLDVNSKHLQEISDRQLRSGAMNRENRAGGIEHYGPEGHYDTVFIVAYDVARSAGRDPTSAYILARTMALGSQLPDMSSDYNAVPVARKHFQPFGTVSHERMSEIQSKLHSLLPEGRPHNVAENREAAGVAMSEAIAAGDYGLAGVLAHRLGDSYSHTYQGSPSSEWGYEHGWGHARDGEAPDDMYRRPRLAQRYVADLANRIAIGLGATGERRTRIVSSGLARWNEVFSGSRDQAQFTARAYQEQQGIHREAQTYADARHPRTRLYPPHSRDRIFGENERLSPEWRKVIERGIRR
jgi:hypothetical protein